MKMPTPLLPSMLGVLGGRLSLGGCSSLDNRLSKSSPCYISSHFPISPCGFVQVTIYTSVFKLKKKKIRILSEAF